MSDLKIFTMENIEAEPVSWLWEPYIPSGKITIVQGDPGEGKTTLMLAIAAAVSNGTELPNGYAGIPADVIFQTAEDGVADTIKPKLELLGADCSRIHFIDESEKSLSLADERIEEAVIRTGAKLLVIDPIQAYLGGSDMHSARGMRPLMKSLASVAERTNCAVVIIGHLNKRDCKTKIQYRGLGSIDIYAAARSVLTIEKITKDMRAIIHTKSNLVQLGVPLVFGFDSYSGFNWYGEYNVRCDDDIYDDMQKSNSKESQSDRAAQLIKDMLAGGAVEAVIIIQTAEEQSISSRTLNRAKAILGVNSIKRNGQWYWELPIETYLQGGQGSQHSQDGQMATLSFLAIFPSANNESGAV